MPRRLSLLALDRRDLPAVAPFTVVAMPDTQNYAQSYPATFTAQTRWVIQNQAARNIAFVTQEGDVVNHGSDTLQWQRADAAFDLLDAPGVNLPYSVSQGNHDYATTGDPTDATNYLANFGPQRYAGRSWYGGSSASGRSHFQTFTAGGYTFLHVNLEWEPTAEGLDWAQSVIGTHPGMPTIVTTHSYLNEGGTRTIDQTAAAGANEPAHHAGEAIFRQLVQPNPQVFLVLNGHYDSSTGAARQTSTNVAGLPVYELLFDHQNFGGDQNNGYLRLLTFRPDQNRVDVTTYSPTRDAYLTDAANQFSLAFDFAARFAAQPVLRTVQFQEGVTTGVGPYSGTQDTELRQASPTTAVGNSTAPVTVQADAGATDHALLRFDRIIGRGAGQVPPGATVVSAELVLDTDIPDGGGAGGALYRMARSWTEGDTWATLGNGVQANGTEARATYDAQLGTADGSATVPQAAMLHVDVTRDVQAWAAGEANNGWAVLPWATAMNAVQFVPSEHATKAFRPRLKVVWTPAAATRLQQGVNGYAGAADTYVREQSPTAGGGTARTLWTDAADGTTASYTQQTLLKFDLTNVAPRNATLAAAFLGVTALYDNANAKGAGFRLYRMLQPWSAATTYANGFGGDGIQNDGVEARAGSDAGTGNVDYGLHLFDVTAGVKAWLAGSLNYGWVTRAYTERADGTGVAAADHPVSGARPVLVLIWTTTGRQTAAAADSVAVRGDALAGYTGVVLGDDRERKKG